MNNNNGGFNPKMCFIRNGRLLLPREFYDILKDLLYFFVCFYE